MFSRIRFWLRSILLRSRVEEDMDAELRWHFDQRVDDLLRSGLPADEARRRVRLELGDIEVQKDRCRDALGLRFWDESREDLCFALRSLKKQRLLSATVVVTLAFGIGISSGVFNFLDAMALRPQVNQNADSYVQIFSFFTMDASRAVTRSGATLEEYSSYRDKSRSLNNITAWQNFDLDIGSDHLNPIRSSLVSLNFFQLYGVKTPTLGRFLEPADFASKTPVIVLSESLWRTRFAADSKIVGKIIHVNDQPVTVIGIAPEFAQGRNWSEAWLPFNLTQYLALGDQWDHPDEMQWLELAARLNPGYTRVDVAAELSVLARQQDKLHQGRICSVVVTNGSEIQEPDNAQIIVVVSLIMSMILMVLLVSCANVTTLLLSRADTRQQEFGVRLALGARRGRLIRMLVTETLLLAAVAGVASLYFTYRLPYLLNRWLSNTDIAFSFDPDWRVFAYFTTCLLLAGVLAGLAPAMESLKVDLTTALKGQRKSSLSRNSRWNFRHFLIATQVALSLVLLTGVGLFVRARHKIIDSDPGFETRQVLLTTCFVPSAKTPEQRARIRDELVREVDAIPGVQSTTFSSRWSPFSLYMDDAKTEIQFPGKSSFGVGTNMVSANYFSTLGIPILRGRAIERDDAPCEPQRVCPVVVSQLFASEYLNGSDALGKTVRTSDGSILEIVGLAGDVAATPFSSQSNPLIYQPWPRVAPSLLTPLRVRVNGNPATMSETIGAVVRKFHPDAQVEVISIRSNLDHMQQVFGRFNTLIEIPAVLAVSLAAIGIYGVVSFSVTKSRREMGIRIALGAVKRDIHKIVLKKSSYPIWIGLFAGIILALMGARVMQKGLAERFPVDYFSPVTYLGPAGLVLFISFLAMVIPTFRAAQCDPATTLRDE